MKEKWKPVLNLLFIEFLFFAAVFPKTIHVINTLITGREWEYAYMLFIVVGVLALYIKNIKVFGIITLVCSVGIIFIEKRALACCMPVAVLLWVLINVVFPITCGDYSDKDYAFKAKNVSQALAFFSVVFFGLMVFVLLKTPFLSPTRRIYWIQWPPYFIYYAYLMLFKSNIPAMKKAREKIKKLKIKYREAVE